MMQCPRCEASLPEGSAYCYSCGVRLTEAVPPAPLAGNVKASGLSPVQIGDWQENAPVKPSPPVTPQFVVNESSAPVVPRPVSAEPYIESGWVEFSGVQTSARTPAGAGNTSPPISPALGGSVSSSNYPYIPSSVPSSVPGSVPPVTPAPKRRGPLLAITIILGVLVLAVVFGGVFIGIRIGQSHDGTTLKQAAVTASPTLDSNQLYQQVTSRNPSFVDSLQDATLSSWAVFEKPTYGCEIKSDGLHVHLKDTARFAYCTSGRGKFSNFAFQVEMKILSGAGGGVTFCGDTLGGGLYYFHVYPDGVYHIEVEQNHKLTTELGQGAISSFSSGFGQRNTLAVIAQGSQIYFYVNQKFLTEIQDSTYASGYLGVAASDSTTPAEAVYTNAQIWIL